jgi:prevent-host-death family protein
MTTVGAFEAKTHFSSLLERVAQGEEIVITRHGAPVARLMPVGGSSREGIRATIARLREFSKGQTLDGLSIRALQEEGRR